MQYVVCAMGSHKQDRIPNALIHEASPYLLQHAYNPVQWHAWNETAFHRAQEEDKPVLVSIGYAACHWCHVMERESFEDEKVATFMNTHFVCIKVDREERPDVDAMYMQACQILSGSGGWPLNMFLTPRLQPFMGGTYFPPVPAYGKPSWLEVLTYVHRVFTTQRDTVEEQAEMLTTHVEKQDVALMLEDIPVTGKIHTPDFFEQIANTLLSSADTVHGGFGTAPKFPSTMSLQYLMHMHYFTGNEKYAEQVHLSLRKMQWGGMHDQIGGGFARYSVDAYWMVPHFEKMLYDNALLISLYSRAYMWSGITEYLHVAEQACAFLIREMQDTNGCFYSSLDADSDGEEGKFYTFDANEFAQLSESQKQWARAIWNFSEQGNWEGRNIAYRKNTIAEIAAALDSTEENAIEKMEELRQVLFAMRSEHVRPALDDKIILMWNALTATAFLHAYRASGKSTYKNTANQILQCIREHMDDGKGGLHHTMKKNKAYYPAFLDDHAAYIIALLDMFSLEGETKYLDEALQRHSYVMEHFSDAKGAFYYTAKEQSDIPVRTRELFDNATPSGVSMMAEAMLRLADYTADTTMRVQAERLLSTLQDSLSKYPSAFGFLANAALRVGYPVPEVAVCGPDALQIGKDILQIFHPTLLLQPDATGESDYPLTAGRWLDGETRIFLCREGVCGLPVSTVQDFRAALATF
ncbi:MAG: thioredoxin domain-containing protein [Chitinophagales bacterium]